VSIVFWLSVVALIAAAYFSAMSLSLLLASHTAVERRLSNRGKPNAAQWFADHFEATKLSLSLLRVVTRLVFFALVLVQFTGFGEDAQLTWRTLLLGAGVTAALLWLFASVVASALARYAAVELIVSGLALLRTITYACLPLTKSFGWIDEVIRRLIGADMQRNEAEAELLRRIEDTHRQGGLDPESVALLENVVEFGNTDVGEVMTPRTDIHGLQLTNDLTEIRKALIESGHSRIPVYEESIDNIVGIMYAKDLIPYLGEPPEKFKLKPLLRKPINVPETKNVGELLADFQQAEVHMAIVIDEYGGTAGLVTIEDVLEEIVGEIHDEHDVETEEEPTLHAIDDTHAEVDGRYHIDDLNQQLELGLPEDEEYDTVAGYVLDQLGRVPEVGEMFETDKARFTVVDANATQVNRVGIELLEPVTANGEQRRANGNGDSG